MEATANPKLKVDAPSAANQPMDKYLPWYS